MEATLGARTMSWPRAVPRSLTAAAGMTAAVMLVGAFTLDIAVAGTTGGAPTIRLGSLSADLVRARDSALWPVEGWLYVLSALPLAVFVAGARRGLIASARTATADAASLCLALFVALHALHNLALLTVVQVLAPHYTPGSAEATTVESVASAVTGLGNASFIPGGGVGGAFQIIALGMFAAAQRGGSGLAGWRRRLALVSGVLLALGSLQYVVPGAVAVALVGWIAFIAWMVVTGVHVAAVERKV